MKRIVTCLLVSILLSAAVVFAEVTRKATPNPDRTIEFVFYSKGKEVARQLVDKDGIILKTTGKVPDGVVKEYYESKKLKSEYYYKDNKLEGTIKQYYESGLLREESNYKKGKLDGKYRNYYTTGSLGGEWSYKNGKREGVTKFYWENGNTKAERIFKDGKQEGVCRRYYNSGELRYIEVYKNGKLINKKKYNANGEIIYEKNYTH